MWSPPPGPQLEQKAGRADLHFCLQCHYYHLSPHVTSIVLCCPPPARHMPPAGCSRGASHDSLGRISRCVVWRGRELLHKGGQREWPGAPFSPISSLHRPSIFYNNS